MADFNLLRRRIPSLPLLGATKFRAAAAALALLAVGCGEDDPKQYDFESTSVGLHAFDDCAELTAYFQAEALSLLEQYGDYEYFDDAPGRVGGEAVGAPESPQNDASAGGQGDGVPDYSRTNTQEADVDEPDLVKTDGRWLYLVRGGYLLIYDASDLSLLSKIEAPSWDGSLMLHEDHLLLLSSDWGAPFAGPAAELRAEGPTTTAIVYDVSDRAAPREVRRVTVQGQLLAARAAKGTARIAVQFDGSGNLAQRYEALPGVSGGVPERSPEAIDVSPPQATDGAEGADEAQADAPPAPKTDEAADWKTAARKIIVESTATDWLPQMQDSALDGTRPAVACGAMFRPGERAGLAVTAVISVDLGSPDAALAHTGVVSGPGVVYMSSENLYLSTGNHWGFAGGGVAIGGEDVAVGSTTGAPGTAVIESPLEVDDRQATQIHRMTVDDPNKAPIYQGTARVYGAPLNQFSLSEHAAHLRIATTEQRFAEDFSQTNHVFVVENEGMTVSGSVEGIADDERIYATRFMGDKGYVVTYRQVDPLFTLDLSDPSAPAVVGELKVPGFSTYLHPFGEHHLIGIGRSATEEGLDTGMQLSLFDITKFAAPTLAHKHLFGEAWSDAQYDHHAFTFWGDRSLLFVPISAWDEQGHSVGVDVFKVSEADGFAPVAFIEHDDDWSSVQRSVVIGDMVYTISGEGMKATALDGMEPAGAVDFPQAEGHGGGVEPRLIDEG